MSGLIPRPFIDDLLTRTDIVEFIDSHIPLKKRGSAHIACCPFHHEKTPSFNVVAKKQFYHCFGCGASGNAISFAMNYLHLSFSEAIETLAARAGLQVPREGREKTKTQDPTLYQFLGQVAQFYQQTLKRSGATAVAYLKNRQVNKQVVERYQIGFAPEGWHLLASNFPKHAKELLATGMVIAKENGKTYDRYRQRIMFPIHDRHGRIIGFGGRAILDTQTPKYLNSPETSIFQKSRELYGLYQVLQHQQPENILVVEGYMDVIALAQHGIFNAVGTLGTATTGFHIQLLSKYTRHIIFCFDGDEAGKKAAKRALEQTLPHLSGHLQASFIILPEGHDPDSLIRKEGAEAFKKRTQNATPLHRFFINSLTNNIDFTNLANKSELIHQAKGYLLNITNEPYKELLIEELARITHIESHRIHQMISEKKSHPATQVEQKIKRTPIRIAIALILQHPEIITSCQKELAQHTLDPQKHQILKTLIQQIETNPLITTAQLVEAWRNTPIFEALTELAMWETQVPEEAMMKEFLDIVRFLIKQHQDEDIQLLIKKAQEQKLTETEKMELLNKLKQRHQ